MKPYIRQLLITTACAFGTLAVAASQDELIRPIQDQWAEIKYNKAIQTQADLYHALAQQAHLLAESHPAQAEPLIWEGIVLSSEAGAKGGLGALSRAKEAKLRFDQAIALNATALSGSAYTSLATLYAKVPGWPLGFGDKVKAEALFKEALTISPRDMDANFFYGDFLLEQGRKGEAQKYLKIALNAEARPGRELADLGRRHEVEALLKKLIFISNM
jgi:predicted Zn-dependent protease